VTEQLGLKPACPSVTDSFFIRCRITDAVPVWQLPQVSHDALLSVLYVASTVDL